MGRRLSQSERTFRELQKKINSGVRLSKAVDRAMRSSNRGRRKSQSSDSGCLFYLFVLVVLTVLLAK